ncbi:ion channel [Paenibacillus aurantius]|uniref:Ion channel n=1 Tax=Paenibacillus aurantius TaxID=2918900 RepID=A0AA96LCX9_9BACL|nr:ion channel [Paenibacillus aurantius]WNQ11361.1 ion channel [Paenibacillus aurantius]
MHFFLRYAYRLFRLNNRLLAVMTVGFVLIGSAAAYALEPDTFGHWFNSLYWVMTTMSTVGYGDYSMKTIPGKALTMVLYLFGIGLLSLVIGKILEAFASIKKRRETGQLAYRGSGHVVIISWNKKAQAAVEELLSSDPGLEVLIVDENERLPYDHERVHYVSGSPTSGDTLERAGVGTARAAIVFADERMDDYQLIDGKTLLIASSIEEFSPDVHTTVEIMSEKHIKNFRHVKVNDFILSHDAVSSLAVRSALNEGTIDLYRQLISRQEGEDIYEVPRRSHWRTYREAFQALLEEGATLLADRGDLGINRKLDEPIPEGARLYAVCHPDTFRRLKEARESG